MDPITITIQLTPADVRRFTRYLWGSWFSFKKILPFAAILLFVGVSFYFQRVGESHLHAPHSTAHVARHTSFIEEWGSALIFAGLFFLFFIFRLTSARNLQKNHPGALLPNTYTVLDEGLFCRNTRGETLYYWKTVTRFVETGDYFFLMISRRSGYVFPKRCLSNIEAATFANQIRLHLEKEAPAALVVK